MLQGNVTKSDKFTFVILNVDWVLGEIGYYGYMNENTKPSAKSILMLYIHFRLSFPDTCGAS